MKTVDKLLDNGKSHIAIYNNKSVKIIDNKTKAISNRAITIMPGFQIEFGRSIKDVFSALAKIHLPIIIEEYLTAGNFKYYNVVRLETGNIPEFTICKIGVTNEVIMEVLFDSELTKNNAARKTRSISAIASVAIKANDISSIEMDAISTITSLKGENAIDYSFNILDYKIRVIANYNDFNLIYTYLMDKKDNTKYRLIGIGYKDK